MDKGYDNGPIHDDCMDRDVAPVTALRQTERVKRGEDKRPTCEHGEWAFPGADYKRKATKWRCPTGECRPASRWIKADRLHPLVPRETLRWRKLYRGRASGRAQVREPQAPVGLAAAARAWDRAGRAPRRPDDPREAACALARARAVSLAA